MRSLFLAALVLGRFGTFPSGPNDGITDVPGVRVAHARPDAIEAMALGHARLVNRLDGRVSHSQS